MDFGIIEDLLHDEQTPPTDIKVIGGSWPDGVMLPM